MIGILLVDDEEEFASVLAERLTNRGIEADIANNGIEAIKKVKESEKMQHELKGCCVHSRGRSRRPVQSKREKSLS